MNAVSELIKTARNIKVAADFVKDLGNNTDSVFDLEENLRGSLQMQTCVARLKADPAMAQMITERYMGPDVDLDQLLQMPPGSLGYTYAKIMKSLNYNPEFYRPTEIKTDADYVVMRMRKTHDIHHIITGFTPKAAETGGGELGVIAVNVAQMGYPSFTVLLLTALVLAWRKRPDLFDGVLKQFVMGLQMGWDSKLLLAQKWEEGWDKPLDQWRSELHLKAMTSGPQSWADTIEGLEL
jgi:ubiquinone biosynthesis protein COQ4